jgi:hypothetical protein
MFRSQTYFILFILALGAACQTTSAPTIENANTNIGKLPNSAVTVDPKNMPEGLSTSPITPNPNGTPTPGIPDPKNINVNMPKGATTPGIPDLKTMKNANLPKGTQTPGIPDPAKLNANQVNKQ